MLKETALLAKDGFPNVWLPLELEEFDLVRRHQ